MAGTALDLVNIREMYSDFRSSKMAIGGHFVKFKVRIDLK